MMSAPVHRDDETDDFQFYAPPRVRERSLSPAPNTEAVNSPAAPSGSEEAPATSRPDAPESIVSPPTEASGGEARGDSHERPAPSSPRMALGVGGPNIHSRAIPPAPLRAAGVKSSLKFAPVQGSEDEGPVASRRRPFEGDVAIKA